MNLLTLQRQPLSPEPEGVRVCETRGHCGPFANEAFYDAFPEPLWSGMGDCVQCGTTRVVKDELLKTPELDIAA